MINLLPDNKKESVKKEYRLRIVSVALVFLSVLILSSIVLLAPAYVFSYLQKRNQETQTITDKFQEATKKQRELTAKVQEIKRYTDFLKPSQKTIQSSEIIDKILKAKGAGIAITDISYIEGDKTGFKVTLQGTSKTREGLMNFSTQLKQEKKFTKVDLPVSGFTKESDLSFSISIDGMLP